MPVFRRLGKELASALGKGLSFSILVFESESLNRRDREIAEGCQLSLTTLILHILQLAGIGIASFIPQVYSQAFLFPFICNISARRRDTAYVSVL